MPDATPMLGTIAIKDLQIRCIVGLRAHERVRPQVIYLDVECDRDIARAVADEDVTHTLDYSEAARALTELVQAAQFWLIETLASEACAYMMRRWPALVRCRITVKKPSAIGRAAYAAVTVEQRRG
ncbi:MAG: dihydroneopterin aldolase [Alphaproteobacteria bacterium]|nr:dihydroneopterin aldolase [Alphaproteobacteria bacterium]